MTIAEALGKSFPPLAEYWPNLGSCSTKQAAFLTLTEDEAFFGGAAGPGKSEALLAGALKWVDHPEYAALILRRTFSQLSHPDAIMNRALSWWKARPDVHWNEKQHTFTFPSGATITFGYLEHENDVFNYQGSAAQYVAFDELTQFSENQYTYLFSRMRSTHGIPLNMRSASNPGGVGHIWVKNRFVEHRTKGRIFVPSVLEDHPDEVYKTSYRGQLQKLPEHLRKQLEDGDWDAIIGAAYVDFSPDTHVVEKFDPPEHWLRFESMDHGTTAPTAWFMYAVDTDGNIIVCDEYYMPNTLPDEDAAMILKRRLEWWERRDNAGWAIRHNCYGDPSSIRERLAQKDEFGQPMTLQDLFRQHGVWILPANNRRRVGYNAIRLALKPDPQRRFPLWHPRAGDYGSPRLFVVGERCPNLVKQITAAPLADGENDPDRGEVVDQAWERHYGHAHAALRYGITTFQNPSDVPDDPEPQTPEEIRKAYFNRQQEHMRDSAAARQREQEQTIEYWGG